MGSWIALNQFKHFKSQIKGFIGIGSAEFLSRLMWDKFSKETKKEIIEYGKVLIKNGNYKYPITLQLIKDEKNKSFKQKDKF